MTSLAAVHPPRNPRRTTPILLPALALILLVSTIASAQDVSDKRANLPGASLDQATEQAHASMRATQPTCTASTTTLGQTINGVLSSTDCSSTSSSGTLYVDFYAFTATAGHTVTVTTHSSLSYLATIQDFSAGTVLASSGSCGLSQDACTFTYLIPTSGTYLAGFGSYGFGNYDLTLTDSAPATCSNTTTLCLSDSSFSVTVQWATTDGRAGSGTAVPFTSDTGYFWFFNSSNVELVIKVLDGRGINGHHWVFYGALSDVAYTIVVTNRQTGATRTYTNAQGNLASVADTEAFEN